MTHSWWKIGTLLFVETTFGHLLFVVLIGKYLLLAEDFLTRGDDMCFSITMV